MALCVIEGRLTKAQAARVYGVSPKIVARWVERYKAGGSKAMADRSSRPRHNPNAVDRAIIERIVALRRQRWTGQHIAMQTGTSPATVSRVLSRAGLSRLKDIDPAEPVRRYERSAPGEIIHLDIKKLGKFKSDRPPHHWKRAPAEQSAQQRNCARLGICPRRHRRSFPVVVHPNPRGRESLKRCGSSQGCRCLVSAIGDYDRAGHDR